MKNSTSSNCLSLTMALTRAATAIQVAAYDYLDCEANDQQGIKREIKAMKTIHAKMAELIKEIEELEK